MAKLVLFFLSVLFIDKIYSQSNKDSILSISRKKDTAERIVHKNWRKYGSNKYMKSFQDGLDSGLAYYPENAEMIRLKGMPYLKLGDYQSAYYYFDKATSINPSEYHYISYVTIFHLRDFQRGLNGLKIYDRLTPKTVDIVMGDNILYLYGLCYQQLNRRDSALLFLDSLINSYYTKNPATKNYLSYLLRGIVRYEMGQYDLSQNDIQSAIELYQNCSECFYYKAKNELKLNCEKQKILESILKSEELYVKGYKNREPYRGYIEMPNMLYLSDIKEFLNGVK
jgi:tetratricopeptide (TPR) repeat protein